MKHGKVYLVGAGPGDPGLMTVKGMRCLRQADIVIYDKLLDVGLIDSVKEHAVKIYAGKSSHTHSMEQEDINRLLIESAQAGKTVVRLKGGDPFVFGRGGEEALALAEQGIEFEIIPGVTSAVAVPAYAGIPVTCRDFASSFIVITGHESPDKCCSSINWEKVAATDGTLVVLMGTHNLPDIIARLLECGRPADTPVAVINRGTGPEQQTVTGILGNIAERVVERDIQPPSVIIVGEVVRLREKLSWFDNRSLFGKHILVTRPLRQSGSLRQLLQDEGANVLEFPAIEIQRLTDTEKLDTAILELVSYDWLLFTSVNGVAFFFERLNALKLDARALGGLKVGAIGPATAGLLREKGVIPDYVPSVFTGQGLLDGFSEMGFTGQRVLLPRADIADNELTDGLLAIGAKVHEVYAYKTVPAVKESSCINALLSEGKIDVITFTSSSTVNYLLATVGSVSQNLAGAKIACIGPKTAETARNAGLKVDIVANDQTMRGLVESTKLYFSKEKK